MSEKPTQEPQLEAEEESVITPEVPAEPDPETLIVNDDDTEVSARYADVYMNHELGSVAAMTKEADNIFLFFSETKMALRIHCLTDQMIRFRYALRGEFPADFSYAIDEQFAPTAPKVVMDETSTHYVIKTAVLKCFIDKTDMRIRMENLDGEVVCEDSLGFQARSTILKGLERIGMHKKSPANEYFFGLGDKSSILNLRGKSFENWATDSFAYGEGTDPLYKSIPFYYGLKDGVGYGIFFDNSYRTHFDFAETDPEEVAFWAEGGEMNYYFIYGPELLDIARQYTDLTGKPEMPPMWALGFHQCRWSYFPDARVREVANEFRKRRIPCDAIYLDIDYMDGYRCFTWNKKLFPNPTSMIKDLRHKGFRTVVMIDPGLKVDDKYEVYAQGKERDYYCRRPDGDLMLGPVWPSECAFPDFTRPEVRSWWGYLYRELYSKNQVAGFWNDMNEPAVFKVTAKTFPEDVRHSYDGHPCSHSKAHNIYGLNMARATRDGLLSLKSHRRPFVITRATYAGGQRYSCVWTGDNVASWEHLQIANRQCQRLSISGFSFTGSDIGGFVDYPSGELVVRWLQLGIFHPLYRIHSMGNNVDGAAEVDEDQVSEAASRNRLDQEPWAFGQTYEAPARKAIELRYQLLPYIYTTFRRYVLDGTPMLRSMSFYDQRDPYLLEEERDFMFGDQLLVSPVIQEGLEKQKVYLPKGEWYYYWTGEGYTGGEQVTVGAPLSRIPMFIKAGSILPHYPVRQYTDEFPVDEVMLHTYYAEGTHESKLYEDYGDGFNFKQGEFSDKTFQFTGSASAVTVTQAKEGHFRDTYLHIHLLFYGLPFTPSRAVVDGQAIEVQTRELAGQTIYQVSVNNGFKKVDLS